MDENTYSVRVKVPDGKIVTLPKEVIAKQLQMYLVDVLDCPIYLKEPIGFQLALLVPYVKLYGFLEPIPSEFKNVDSVELLRDGSPVTLTQAFKPFKQQQYRVLWPVTAPVGFSVASHKSSSRT